LNVREVLDFADAKKNLQKPRRFLLFLRMLGRLDEESVNPWAEIAQCPANCAYRCAPATHPCRPMGEGEEVGSP